MTKVHYLSQNVHLMFIKVVRHLPEKRFATWQEAAEKSKTTSFMNVHSREKIQRTVHVVKVNQSSFHLTLKKLLWKSIFRLVSLWAMSEKFAGWWAFSKSCGKFLLSFKCFFVCIIQCLHLISCHSASNLNFKNLICFQPASWEHSVEFLMKSL